MSEPIQEFNLLKNDLESFSNAFKAMVTNKKHQIIDDKTNFNIKLNDLKSEQVKLSSQINQMKNQKIQVLEQIEQNFNNLDTRKSQIDQLRIEEQNLIEKKAKLDAELNDINNQINQLNDKIQNLVENLDNQVVQDDIEIVKYEKYLGLNIEVLHEKKIRFKFHNLDPNNIDKQFWIDLNIGDEFTISDTFPALSESELKAVIDELNREQKFGKFLKQIRSLLKNNI